MSAKEELNNKITLSNLASRVVQYLTKGQQNVVIDDENELFETRKIYLNAIKENNNPKIKVKAISFEPLGGIQQCKWNREWKLASFNSKCELDHNFTICNDFDEIKFNEWAGMFYFFFILNNY